MLKSKGRQSTEINVIEKPNLFSIIKALALIVIAIVLVMSFVKEKGVGNVTGEGVVFKNISKKYSNIESSYDEILLNKNISEDVIKKEETGHNVFYIDYNGTLMASEVKYLRSKVDAIVLKANEDDEVVLRITSPGGAVSGYGLIASQINRLKVAGLKITAVVDTVAASGGYMAAVVADEIVAAPFAMVGSIGVVANVMIYEDLLKGLGVESRVYTAGESKRSVVPTRIPTEEEEKKLKSQLEGIHNKFKEHVLSYRSDIDLDKVFTGEAFLASEAIDYGLVDKIGTSDELLLSFYKEGHRLIKVDYQLEQSFAGSLAKEVSMSFISTIKEEIFSNQVQIN